MNRPLDQLTLVLPLLSLFLGASLACDAPEVVPREPLLVTGAATPTGPRAEQLRQVEAMRGQLEGADSPVGILVALANLYYESGRYPEAIDFYRQAVEKAAPAIAALKALPDPGVPPTAPRAECAARADAESFPKAIAFAEGLARSGKKAEAFFCYRQALGLVAGAYARRGAAWAVIEQIERGLAEIEKALEITPEGPEPLFLYGAVVFNTRDGAKGPFGEKATAAWRLFLEKDPDHPRAAQVRRAMESMQAQTGLPSGHPTAGAIAPAARPAAGPASAELPAALTAGLPPALVQVATLLAAGNTQAAISISDQFLAVAPQHGGALALKAQALAMSGQGASARELAKAALAAGPNARAEHVLGLIEEQLGANLEAAKTHYRSSIEVDSAYAGAAGVTARLIQLETAAKAPGKGSP